MKNLQIFALLLCASVSLAFGQDKVFDWTAANAETLQLVPAEYQTGRVYRPGPEGGNIHVDIDSEKPITIALTPFDEWNAALQNPEYMSRIEWRCLDRHVVSATYTCELPPNRAMVLVLRDERNDHAALTGVDIILGRNARPFLPANDVHIQYYSWTCVDHCLQPEFQWVRLVKEKYAVTSTPKIYSLLTPERDGQQLSVKIKAASPMVIAVMSSQLADKIYDSPGILASALSNTSCKQRGVQSMNFDCTFNLADGPQSLIVMPDGPQISHKKAEIELQTVKCVGNCDLMK
jgi:hypothetical protein